jgi:glyoxylase-like metal-dependent hydrolase (beta-lactamase superfamily II)
MKGSSMLLKDGIISLGVCIRSHIYIVPTSNGKYTLIDASLPAMGKKIIKELKSLIDITKIERILITHTDIDHIGSAKYLVKKIGCDIYASQKEIDNFLKKSERTIKKHFLLRILLKICNPINAKKIKPLVGSKIGDFEIIDEPGHCYGQVGYKFNDVLFCGDLIQTRKGVIEKIPDNFNLDQNLYINTIKNFDMSGINLICQAHGKPIVAHPA